MFPALSGTVPLHLAEELCLAGVFVRTHNLYSAHKLHLPHQPLTAGACFPQPSCFHFFIFFMFCISLYHIFYYSLSIDILFQINGISLAICSSFFLPFLSCIMRGFVFPNLFIVRYAAYCTVLFMEGYFLNLTFT